jgi:hypothetical protein
MKIAFPPPEKFSVTMLAGGLLGLEGGREEKRKIVNDMKIY